MALNRNSFYMNFRTMHALSSYMRFAAANSNISVEDAEQLRLSAKTSRYLLDKIAMNEAAEAAEKWHAGVRK